MSEVTYRYRLSCGCEYVTPDPEWAGQECERHDAPALVVERKAHVWAGMRRVDVDGQVAR